MANDEEELAVIIRFRVPEQTIVFSDLTYLSEKLRVLHLSSHFNKSSTTESNNISVCVSVTFNHFYIYLY
jgi:hypothetical protein